MMKDKNDENSDELQTIFVFYFVFFVKSIDFNVT